MKPEDTIKQWKKALVEIRSIYRLSQQLIKEYDEQPSPHSPSLETTKGLSLSQEQRLNNYTFKRELLKIKIDLCQQAIKEFEFNMMALPSIERQILEIFITSGSYDEMYSILNRKCGISISAYKRKMPSIYLLLDNIMDITKLPTVQSIHEVYLERLEEYKSLL